MSRPGSLAPAAPRADTRIFLASLALSAANALKLILQFSLLPILARLLGPEVFGLVALAMPFILLAGYLSDAGLGAGLARRTEVSVELESTVFWLASGLGLGLTLLICALAMPVAALVGQPALSPVLMALSPILFLGGMLSAANARVIRERRFGVFAVGDLSSTVLSCIAALAAALQGWGVWSLVVQQLVLWSAKAIWIFTATRLRPRLVCRPSLAREMLGFGINAAGANLAEFLSKNIDNVLIGVLLGTVSLGWYAMAYQAVAIPNLIIAGPLYLTLFTAVARVSTERSAATTLIASSLQVLALCITPVFVGLMLVGDLAVLVALGPKWEPVAILIPLLAPAGLLLCLFTFVGASLMGMGRADLQFRLSLATGLAVALSVWLGSFAGVVGVAVGVSLAVAAIAPAYFWSLQVETGVTPGAVGAAFWRPLLAATVMAAAVGATRSLEHRLDPLIQLLSAIAAGAGAYGLAILLLGGRALRLQLARIGALSSRRGAP